MLEQVGPTGASGGWMYQSFDLDAMGMTGIESFSLRVIASDEGTGSVVEAGFDGVQLVKLDCVDDDPCPADIDDNGHVNVDDILLVIAAFGTSGPDGDTNGDGTVDVNDLLEVVGSFGPC
jgi:hypothetical protein